MITILTEAARGALCLAATAAIVVFWAVIL